MNKMKRNPKLCLTERNKFINRVNRVLRQHKRATIKEFKICFSLDRGLRLQLVSGLSLLSPKKLRY